MFIQPYLYFNGQCEEALNFYRDTLDAEVTVLMRFKENPDPQACVNMPPGSDEKVMHANVQIRDTQIMASDGDCNGKLPKYDGFSLTLNVAGVEEAEKTYNALAKGGQVQIPLMETFFADRFGMVADRFGVPWIVIAEKTM